MSVRAHIPVANLAPDLVCLPWLAVVLMNGMRAVRDSSLEAWKAAAALLYQSPSQMKGEKTDIERQAVNRSAKPLLYFGSHAVTHPIT